MSKFEVLIEDSLLALSEELAPFGYALNASKTVLLPSFQGVGAWTAHKYFSDRLGTKYEVADAARYLGGCVDARLSTGEEVKRRCRASRVAFFQMGGLWFEKGLPMGFRRSMMMALVQGSLLSGLEGFFLSDQDMQRLDTLMAGLLRLAMRGRASGRSESGYKAMSNAAVLAHWRIAPAAEELAQRRLRQLQSIARDPANATQLLAAWFGQARFEGQATCSEEAGLSESANPWAKRVFSDFERLRMSDDHAWMVEDVQGDFVRLLRARHLAEAFADADLSVLRARLWGCRQPPPGADVEDRDPPAACSVELDADGVQTSFVCEEVEATGVQCGRVFSSMAGLHAHRRFGHRLQRQVALLTLSNQCPWCMTTFASRQSAQHHTSRALFLGRCRADRSSRRHQLVALHDFVCPQCHETAGRRRLVGSARAHSCSLAVASGGHRFLWSRWGSAARRRRPWSSRPPLGCWRRRSRNARRRARARRRTRSAARTWCGR